MTVAVTGGQQVDLLIFCREYLGLLLSLWKVDDGGTTEFMQRYYGQIPNTGRSEALRQVQLGLLNSPEYSHPYYWSAFIFSGDWAPMAAGRP